MDAFDLAELQRVDHQADIAVPREPGAVMLVAGLGTHGDAIAFTTLCPQTYRIAGSGPSIFFGRYRFPVTYRPGRDWKCSFSTTNSSCSSLPVMTGFRIGPFRQRIEAQHLADLPPILAAPGVPVVQRLDLSQTVSLQCRRLTGEVIGQEPIAAAGVQLGGGGCLLLSRGNDRAPNRVSKQPIELSGASRSSPCE